MQEIRQRSSTLDKLIDEGKIAIVGAMYNISTAEVSFFQVAGCGPSAASKLHQSDLFKEIMDRVNTKHNTIKKSL